MAANSAQLPPGAGGQGRGAMTMCDVAAIDWALVLALGSFSLFVSARELRAAQSASSSPIYTAKSKSRSRSLIASAAWFISKRNEERAVSQFTHHHRAYRPTHCSTIHWRLELETLRMHHPPTPPPLSYERVPATSERPS